MVGRLRAYDEYLTDVRNVRDELAQQENLRQTSPQEYNILLQMLR